MTDNTLPAGPEILFLRHSNFPTLVLIIILAGAFIGACGLYTGVQIGQRRSDNLLANQKVDYEARLVAQDNHHADEIKRLADNTNTLALALKSLNTRFDERTAIGDQTRATANAAFAIAASAVSAHHDVTRAEYNALAAKTNANANRPAGPTLAEHNALTAEVQANASSARATEAEVKKNAAAQSSSWFGGRK